MKINGFLVLVVCQSKEAILFVCYGSLYVILKTEWEPIGKNRKSNTILLGKILYITWAFIIYYLGKYYYIRYTLALITLYFGFDNVILWL